MLIRASDPEKIRFSGKVSAFTISCFKVMEKLCVMAVGASRLLRLFGR